jgi:hypothetical protein
MLKAMGDAKESDCLGYFRHDGEKFPDVPQNCAKFRSIDAEAVYIALATGFARGPKS